MSKLGPAIRKFGYNGGVSTAEVDVRSEDADLAYQTAAQALEVVSSDAADAAAGTGARTILVEGLDGNYLPVSETVTLNGTTAVDLVNTYLRVLRAYVVTVGTGLKNAGTITISLDGAGATQAVISIGDGQTQISNHTISAGRNGTLKQIDLSVSQSAANAVLVLFKVYKRLVDESWRMIMSHSMTNGSISLELPNAEETFPAKTDIRISAIKIVGTGDARCEAAYTLEEY